MNGVCMTQGLFYGTARMLRKLEGKKNERKLTTSALEDLNSLYMTSYVCIVLAILSWVSDNAFCDQVHVFEKKRGVSRKLTQTQI